MMSSKADGTMNPIFGKEVSQNCEAKAYLPVQGGRGLGWSGMANKSELSINSVTWNKPKALIGLSQKASGWLTGVA